MADSYTSLFYHFVFSTKNRANFIRADIEERIWAYIGGVARKHKMAAIQIGGIEDHVHVLILAPTTIAPFEIAKYLKGDSSKWIKEEFADLQAFAWQDGYGAFTVSKSNIPAVVEYIQSQRVHHQKKSFQEEYLEFLQKHGVEYNEKHAFRGLKPHG